MIVYALLLDVLHHSHQNLLLWHHLYIQNEKIQVLNKDFIAELRIMNENTIKQNNSYHEFVQNMIKLSNDKK